VQEIIGKGFVGFPISIAVVWIDMLPPDDEAAAAISALLIRDPRARHFHDPDALVGKAVAASFGNPGAIAWDMYLFYPKEVQWHQEPPIPVEWAHQLSDAWADRNHFHWNERLVLELKRIMARLSR
jgi:hypothetical protein